MKNTLLKVLSGGLIVFGLLVPRITIAQTYQRADSQISSPDAPGLLMSPDVNTVEDPTLSIDVGTDGRGDLSSASTIKASTGIVNEVGAYTGYQELIFPTGATPGANQTTYIRLDSTDDLFPALLGGSLGSALATILGNVLFGNQEITVEAKNNTTVVLSGQTQNSNDFASENLRVVSDANNNYYAAITPSVAYDRIRIQNRIGTLLGIGNTKEIDLYGAYYNTSTNNCEQAKYTSFSGSGGLISALNASSGVLNAGNAIDSDPNSYSSLRLPILSVAGDVQQTIYFEGPSASTDTYHLSLASPSDIISLDLLDNIYIEAYNGSSLVDSQQLSSLIDLDLLGIFNSNDKVNIAYTPNASANRIRVRVQNLVNLSLTSELRLYSITKNPPLPTTNFATQITTTTATLNGSLSDPYNCMNSTYGFEYSTDPDFAEGTGAFVTSSNLSSGDFSFDLTGLNANTNYYFRAVANVDVDGNIFSNYGSVEQFFTGSIIWDGTEWNNEIGPDATDSSNGIATINGDYNTGTHGSLAVHDLTIINGNTLTVESTNSFTLSGSITAPDESIDASEGEIIFLGTDNIVLDGDLLVDKDVIADNRNGHQIDKVQVNTTGGAELEVLNEVEVMTSLNLGTEGILALQDNAEIIFNSDGNGTAFFGEVGGVCTSSRITYGNDAGVTVERYIPAGSTEGGTVAVRAYRMLTSAVNAGTINSNWQEGDTDATYNTGNNSLGNIVGFGTHITVGSNANGFDYNATNNPSAYTYNNQDQSWSALANTDATNLNVGDPYYINIRGDRTLDMSTNAPDPISTTIRTKGTLKLCDSDLTSATLADGDEEFSFFGNPYQAPVDMNEVLTNTGTSEINPNFIWVWDPNLSTKGAYVVINVTDNTKSNSSSNANRFLQAGQAIFVANSASMTGSPNLSFEENDKNIAEDNLGVFRPSGASYALNILLKSGANTLDAAVIDFSDDNDNSVNDYDAKKLGNSDENLALVNGNHFLSIEQRDIPVDLEEIPLYVGSYRHQDYQLLINWEGIPNLKAFVVDNYLQTSTALAAGENIINFSIDEQIAASVENDRFKITFEDSSLASNTVEANGFSLYPNPLNNGVLNISNPNYTGEMEVSIFNNVGQLMMMKSHTAITGNTSINMSQLAAGVYLVKVTTENTTFTKKVVNP